jgi:hypothetical protein
MKTKILLLFMVLLNLTTFAQISGVVKNTKDQKPIPYVNIWIENENIGVTADEEGKFTIAASTSSKLVFNALGYENKLIEVTKIDRTIYLTPKAIELKEVKVISKKESLEYKVGSFRSGIINSFYAGNDYTPYVVTRYFPYQTDYKKTPFIKLIMPYCKSDIADAKFKVRVYSSDKNGLPGDEILKNNIIITVKKGSSKPVINLSEYNLVFPESGIFIGFEFMFLESNRYDYTSTDSKTKQKLNSTSIEPAFGTISTESDLKQSLKNINGKWAKLSFGYPFKDRKNRDLLAMELTLTN